ncbi:MAG: hypothetical protein WBR18_02545 [Anaerolineales bacterium]
MGRDLRKFRQGTTQRLVIGFTVLLLVVGDGLIYWIYGRWAALSGLLCIAGALVLFGLLWAILIGLSALAERLDR